MASKELFLQAVQQGYTFKGESFRLGVGMFDKQVVQGAEVLLPLKTMNRHGLIAGATGTGKTKTLQVIAEGLSDASIPVVLMDIKGDLSGIAAAGASNSKIEERIQLMGGEYKPSAFPVELMTLSDDGKGVRLRATVSEFGPILLSKILGLNDTQQGIVAMIFKFCDDNKMPLLSKISALLSGFSSIHCSQKAVSSSEFSKTHARKESSEIKSVGLYCL